MDCVACQAPLSVEFFRKEYWTELQFPTPGDLPDPEIKPASSALAGTFFTTVPPGNTNIKHHSFYLPHRLLAKDNV